MNNKNCFDFLRFFFAANILLSHLAGLSQNKHLKFLYSYVDSEVAIKGFFVISGFLVAKSYVNTPSLKQYFIKRAKRILPAYIFVVTLAALVLVFFSSYAFSEYFNDSSVYKYLSWNYIFLNFMHPCLPGVFYNNQMCAVNGSLWTLKVEESFYLVLPLIFYVLKKTKKPLLILGSLYALSLLYWFVMEDYLNKPMLAKQLPGYLAYFVVGIVIFMNFDYIMQNKKKILPIALTFFLLYDILPSQTYVFYPAAFGALVIIGAYSLPFLNNFGKYGDFTYGLYIYHFPIIQLFRQYDLFEKYNPILMGGCVVAITFMCALCSWFFIEKRFLDRYKKKEIKPKMVLC